MWGRGRSWRALQAILKAVSPEWGKGPFGGFGVEARHYHTGLYREHWLFFVNWGAGEEEARRQLGGHGNGFWWLGHLAVQRKRCILEQFQRYSRGDLLMDWIQGMREKLQLRTPKAFRSWKLAHGADTGGVGSLGLLSPSVSCFWDALWWCGRPLLKISREVQAGDKYTSHEDRGLT